MSNALTVALYRLQAGDSASSSSFSYISNILAPMSGTGLASFGLRVLKDRLELLVLHLRVDWSWERLDAYVDSSSLGRSSESSVSSSLNTSSRAERWDGGGSVSLTKSLKSV